MSVNKLYFMHEKAIKKSVRDDVVEEKKEGPKLEENTNAELEKARMIIESAEQMTSRIQEKAKAELKKAHEEGFQEGYLEGISRAIEENENTLNDIKRFLSELEAAKEKIINEYYQDAKKLSLIVAEKIINEKLEIDDSAYLNLYKKAAEELIEPKVIKLTVSNCEKQMVTSNMEYIRSVSGDVGSIGVEVMGDAPRGTCIIETDNQIVDASVVSQMNLIRKSVLTES